MAMFSLFVFIASLLVVDCAPTSSPDQSSTSCLKVEDVKTYGNTDTDEKTTSFCKYTKQSSDYAIPSEFLVAECRQDPSSCEDSKNCYDGCSCETVKRDFIVLKKVANNTYEAHTQKVAVFCRLICDRGTLGGNVVVEN